MNTVICDKDNHPVRVDVCKRNHQSAKQTQIMREKQGKPSQYDPCLKCPTAIGLTENQKHDLSGYSPYVKGKCSGCGEERSILKNKGICQKCLSKNKAKLETAPAPVEKQTTKVEWVTDGARLILDFSKHPWIYKALEKQAENELRTIDRQAMWMLLSALGGVPQ